MTNNIQTCFVIFILLALISLGRAEIAESSNFYMRGSLLVNDQSKYFLLYNGTIKLFPDVGTLTKLGFNESSALHVGSEFFRNSSILQPFPSLLVTVNLPDEWMRVELLRINLIQKYSLIKEVYYTGDHLWHPSICRFRDKVLLSARGHEGLYREIPHFHWLNISSNMAQASEAVLIDFRNFSLSGREQVRLVQISNDTVQLSFCVPSATGVRMASSELHFNEIRNIFELREPRFMTLKGMDSLFLLFCLFYCKLT